MAKRQIEESETDFRSATCTGTAIDPDSKQIVINLLKFVVKLFGHCLVILLLLVILHILMLSGNR